MLTLFRREGGKDFLYDLDEIGESFVNGHDLIVSKHLINNKEVLRVRQSLKNL